VCSLTLPALPGPRREPPGVPAMAAGR